MKLAPLALLSSILLGALWTPSAEAYIQRRARVCTRDWNGVLNLRQGPGQEFRTISQMRNNDQIDIISSALGRDGYTWYYVEPAWSYNRYWVRADYICG